MRIIAVASVENDKHVLEQIRKQTIQPDEVYIYVDSEPAKGINNRRKRIARNQRLLQSKNIINGYDLVWQLEGDTVCEPDTLEKLLDDYYLLNSPQFGYVSGVQIGRHGLYCIGAWHVGKNYMKSLDYKLKGLQMVDATGLYCLLAPTRIWLKGYADWTDQVYGPDVVWGLSLKYQGYQAYVDMTVKLGHHTKRGIIHPDHISTCNVRYERNRYSNEWKYKTFE